MASGGPGIVFIGASAGGVEALKEILEGLFNLHPVTIVIVIHRRGRAENSIFTKLISQWVDAPVFEPEDKDPILPGSIYVAGAEYHLLIEDRKTFSLSLDDPVQYSRPSIDVLFESAAMAYGFRAAGVILTGANEDGAAGLSRMAESGGLAIVQDPKTARASRMPLAALNRVPGAKVMILSEIRSFLFGLKNSGPF